MNAVNTALVIFWLCQVSVLEASPCRFGDGAECLFQCHCSQGEQCDSWSGQCPNGCDPLRTGPGCQLSNLALGKKAKQSLTVIHKPGGTQDSSQWVWMSADFAVDGENNTDPRVEPHCAVTTHGINEETMWWQVDLGEIYGVYDVTILIRDDCCPEQASYMSIEVKEDEDSEGQLCATYDEEPPNMNDPVEVSCSNKTAVGRYVQISRKKAEARSSLALCEVNVLSAPYIDCALCPAGVECNSVIGCDACQGAKLPDCRRDCEPENYGVNCQLICGLHCANRSCDSISGLCDFGCEDWYIPDECSVHIGNLNLNGSELAANRITINSIEVAWQSVFVNRSLTNYYFYVLEYRSIAGNAWIEAVETGFGERMTSFDVTNLNRDTLYEFRVFVRRRMNDLQDEGIFSNVLRARTLDIIETTERVETTDAVTTEELTTEELTTQEAVTNTSDPVTAAAAKEEEAVSAAQTTAIVAVSAAGTAIVTVIANQCVTRLSQRKKKKEEEKEEEDTYIPVPEFHSVVEEKKSQDDGFPKQFDLLTGGTLQITPGKSTNPVAVVGGAVKAKVTEKLQTVLKHMPGSFLTAQGDQVCIVLEEDGSEVTESESPTSSISETIRKKQYVAIQGPLSGSDKDIWNMIWTTCTETVVLLSAVTDSDSMFTPAFQPRDKTNKHWPEEGFSEEYGDITVTTTKEIKHANYTIRTIECTKEEETRVVHQFQLTCWSDDEVPEHAFQILRFRNKVRSCDDDIQGGPAVVYSSTGGGRQGFLIALDYLLDQAEAENGVDVFQCVKALQTNRPLMMQSLEQYVFLHDILDDAFQWGDTSLPLDSLQDEYNSLLQQTEDDPTLTELEKQFKMFEAASTSAIEDEEVEKSKPATVLLSDIAAIMNKRSKKHQSSSSKEAGDESSPSSVSDIPEIKEMERVLSSASATVDSIAELTSSDNAKKLTGSGAGTSLSTRGNALSGLSKSSNLGKSLKALRDRIISGKLFLGRLGSLINTFMDQSGAGFVASYESKKGFVTLQNPLPETTNSFWQIVASSGSSTVVMLGDIMTDDKGTVVYWPQSVGEPVAYGNQLEVEMQSELAFPVGDMTCVQRQLLLQGSSSPKNTGAVVTHYQLMGWDDSVAGGKLPESLKKSFLALLGEVDAWHKSSGSGPIVVHCRDGYTRSGLFCASSYLLNMAQCENEIDVVYVLRDIRLTMPKAITSLDQYKFLHELILDYVAQNVNESTQM